MTNDEARKLHDDVIRDLAAARTAANYLELCRDPIRDLPNSLDLIVNGKNKTTRPRLH